MAKFIECSIGYYVDRHNTFSRSNRPINIDAITSIDKKDHGDRWDIVFNGTIEESWMYDSTIDRDSDYDKILADHK